MQRALGIVGLLVVAGGFGLIDVYESPSRGLRVALNPELVESTSANVRRAFTIWYYAKPYPLHAVRDFQIDRVISRVEADCLTRAVRLVSRVEYQHGVGAGGGRYSPAEGLEAVRRSGPDTAAYRAIEEALCRHGSAGSRR